MYPAARRLFCGSHGTRVAVPETNKKERFVAPLKDMPVLPTEAIVAVRKRTLEPFHPLHQIAFRRL